MSIGNELARARVARFVRYRGARILRLDFDGLRDDALLEAFEHAWAEVARAPPGSLRVLTLLHAHFSERSARALRTYALSDRPPVLRSAVVASTFWRVLIASLPGLDPRDLQLFEEEASALEWLTLP